MLKPIITSDSSRYRWVLLGVAWFIQVATRWSWFLLPSLAYILFPDLGINQIQFTLILIGPPIILLCFGIIGGSFGDRYGLKLSILIGTVIFALSGISRAFAHSFIAMFLSMCFCGLGDSFTLPNLPKLVGIWFPRRQSGLATGLYTSAQAIGFGIGLLSGPLFTNWRVAFISTGLMAFVAALLWSFSLGMCR